MIKRITLLGIAILVLVVISKYAQGQTVTFDQLNSNVGSQKAITWNTSPHSSGFGHRIISTDPGGLTTLNIQTRHNTSLWKDIMVINSLGNIGIGLNNPSYPFHLKSSAYDRSRFEYGSTTIDVVSYAAGTYDYSGSAGIWVNGADALLMSGAGKGIRLLTYDGTTATERMRILQNGNIGINTKIAPYTLSVNGTVGAREVNVNTTVWADYVFEQGYNLKPLADVKLYYEKNLHLPEIPSEQEVLQNGVNISEMTVKLLQKIEELTIYLVKQEEEISSLKIEIFRINEIIKDGNHD